MEMLKQFWPLLLPIIIIQYTLLIIALIHAIRHPNYKFGNKPMWIVIIVCGQMIGSIVYLIFGRGEEE